MLLEGYSWPGPAHTDFGWHQCLQSWASAVLPCCLGIFPAGWRISISCWSMSCQGWRCHSLYTSTGTCWEPVSPLLCVRSCVLAQEGPSCLGHTNRGAWGHQGTTWGGHGAPEQPAFGGFLCSSPRLNRLLLRACQRLQSPPFRNAGTSHSRERETWRRGKQFATVKATRKASCMENQTEQEKQHLPSI